MGEGTTGLERLRQAEKASPLFRQFRKMAVDVGDRASLFIARGFASDEGLPWPGGLEAQRKARDRLMPADQQQWLGVAAHALCSQLLEEGEAQECQRWFSHAVHDPKTDEPLQWVDAPGRYVVAGPTGVGKTVLAASMCVEVIERTKQAHGKRRLGTTGVIYSAGSVALLNDLWLVLEAMGCDMTQVAAYYRPKEHQPSFHMSPTPRGQVEQRFAECPVVLVTQQWLNHLSREERDILEQVLQFQPGGPRRAGIWDEAFDRYDITARLTLRNLQGLVGEIRGKRLAQHDDSAIRNGAAVFLEIAESFEREWNKAQVNGSSRKVLIDCAGEHKTKGLAALHQHLTDENQMGSAHLLEVFQEITAGSGQAWAYPPGEQWGQQIICKPCLKVDPMVDRLVILDASYVVSRVRQADITVQVAAGMKDASDWLQPKLFDGVVVNLARGPAGRTKMEREKDQRQGMITRQVERIKSSVPEDESFLVITFKPKKTTNAIDWVELVKTELRRQKVKGWSSRAEFTTWGMHVGRNCWRHIKHIFCFGVLHRDWETDLKMQFNSHAERMQDAVPLPELQERKDAVCGEIVAAIQQLAGRGHCRVTRAKPGSRKGHSGQTVVWAELYEPGSSRGVDPAPGKSLICDALREGMPGVSFSTVERQAPARIKAMAEAGWQWLASQDRVVPSNEIREWLRVWGAKHGITSERAIGNAVGLLKLEALQADWVLKGHSWSPPGVAPDQSSARVSKALGLPDRIVSYVCDQLSDGVSSVGIKEVRNALGIKSQATWSEARQEAEAVLQSKGIELVNWRWVAYRQAGQTETS